MVEGRSAIAETFAGRVHIEWDETVPVTPFGQLPFFFDYLKQAGLFDAWVARPARHCAAVGAGRPPALRTHHCAALRCSEPAVARHAQGYQ
jgi:hypothetical protein